MWGKAPVQTCLDNIITNFRQVFGFEKINFFDITYSILCLVIAALAPF